MSLWKQERIETKKKQKIEKAYKKQTKTINKKLNNSPKAKKIQITTL